MSDDNDTAPAGFITKEQVDTFRENQVARRLADVDGAEFQAESRRAMDRYMRGIGRMLNVESHPTHWKLVAKNGDCSVVSEELFASEPTGQDVQVMLARFPDVSAIDAVRPESLRERARRLPVYGERPLDFAKREILDDTEFGRWLFAGGGALKRQELFWAIDAQTNPCAVSIDDAFRALEELFSSDPEEYPEIPDLEEELDELAHHWIGIRLRKVLGRKVSRDEIEHRCMTLDPLVPPDAPGVYCIKGAGDFVKIGCASRSIRQRVSEIQTSHPVKIELLAVLSRDPRDEKRFHKAFEEFREHGEWFRLEKPLWDAIREARRQNDARALGVG